MTNLVNFLLFQLGWFAAVWGAAHGHLWWGPVAFAVVCLLHVRSVSARGRELRYLCVVAGVGILIDTLLHRIGLLRYPTSGDGPLVPAWIASLWFGFATLPRYSLGWLAGRPRLAFLLGAIGGPLSFLGGTRLGPVAPGDPAWGTWVALGVEYAVLTPWMLARVPKGS